MNMKVYKIMISNSIQQMLIYRTTSLLIVVFGLIFYLFELFSGFVYFKYTDNIMGWTKWDYFSLITTATIIMYGYNFFFVWGDSTLDEEILEGKLDYIFLRPINSFWYYSLYRIDFPSLINILAGIGVQSYIIYKEKVGGLQILMYIVSVIMGVWFIFLFNHLTVTVAFWKERANELTWVPEILTDFSSRPASIYPKIIRFLMIWIIPILTSINLPVDILRGKVNIMSMLWYILFLIVFTTAVYKMWYAGIKKYQSSN
ncbi:ABC transporter permease [Pseudoleptotrichia goodfellowii]|uniref:ABC transporter permease n=1 Tax=Pseudoleptotrichia goodfellowii TaxID=157692 RepID=A0A510JDB9_9FUSO|nr:ABC-2 family transporter protein [Pseudoleptotrichia goodfellowii]BBM36461.1 hypothetical protein JCM16774_1393 [Pseudoleptotrichia goodfellowii]